MNGSTVCVCRRAGRRAGRDPGRNSTQHKDWLSAAAVTHGERIKIYMHAETILESATAVELQGKSERDISVALAIISKSEGSMLTWPPLHSSVECSRVFKRGPCVYTYRCINKTKVLELAQ